MLKDHIEKFAKKCGVSDKIRLKAGIIIDLLEQISSGLSSKKHKQLLDFIRIKTLSPNSISSQENIVSSLKKWSNTDIMKMVKFIGTYFHLLNQAELNEVIIINEERDKISDVDNPKVDGIASAIKYLKENAISFEIAEQILQSVSIHPTFTAHPTETKRQSIIHKQKKILSLIEKMLEHNISEKERSNLEDKAIRLCRLIFLTDDVRTQGVSAKEEIKNTIKNTISALWEAVPLLAEDLESSFYDYYDRGIDLPQFMNFHTWVGGDRDGNPNITSDISHYAVKHQISILIPMYINDLNMLFEDLSISQNSNYKKSHLLQSINHDLQEIALDQNLIDRYESEPVRLKILFIKYRLLEFKQDINCGEKPKYSSKVFQNDLKMIYRFLIEITGDKSLVNGKLSKLIYRSRIFGLHFLSMDIRQHSDVHGHVIGEIISKVLPEVDYFQLSDSEKCDLLKNLIISKDNNFKIEDHDCTDLLLEVFSTFKVIKEYLEIDKEIISSYIISMTHSKSDIFEVLAIGKLSGLVFWADNRLITDLNVVPLYETISDLQSAPALLKDLFQDELYSSHLNNKNKFQEVMLGYSDSNKDGGFGMANFCLNECQIKISELMIANEIDFRIFHGRGGSISRGGGKSNKAILSLPDKCQNGKIRFTEQGEVINYRYGSSRIAKRHLEQVVSAQIIAFAKPKKNNGSTKKILNQLITSSHEYYKEKILNEGCWQFLLSATPMKHISKIPITSRPSSRNKIKDDIVGFIDLRAIPWVFSWTQIRYNLSGWFGMGTALNGIIKNRKSLDELRSLRKKSKFFSQLLDNMSFEMARTRLSTSMLYAKTEDQRSFNTLIESEFELALNAYKLITGYNSLLERNTIISNSIDFRNPLTDILNYAQVELIERNQNSNGDNSNLDSVIFSSINHIAAAMQTTG